MLKLGRICFTYSSFHFFCRYMQQQINNYLSTGIPARLAFIFSFVFRRGYSIASSLASQALYHRYKWQLWAYIKSVKLNLDSLLLLPKLFDPTSKKAWLLL